jgi:hypothetical protein
MTPFLTWLKPFYEAGLIQLCAAAMTLLAVMVALYPHFDRWRKRTRLRLEIPRDCKGERIEPIQLNTGPNQSAPCFAVVTKIRLRNVGKTAAVGVRLTATDFYAYEEDACSLVSIPESPLPPDRPHLDQLPAGMMTRFSVCGSSCIGDSRSGFVVGGAPGGIAVGGPGGQTLPFSHHPQETLSESVNYLVRLVAYADGVTPSTHFVALEIRGGAKVRLATKRERKAIRKADSARAAVEISKG